MGTLVCRIELDKNSGITMTVENKDGKITQRVVMNGDAITLTSQGEQDTSTITQTPDSVAIRCKNFTLETETTTCKSTKDTLHRSDQKFDIQSAQNLTLKTDQEATLQATGDNKISGKNVQVTADTNADISGNNSTVTGTQKAKMTGAQAEVNGSTKAELKGGIVKASATGVLTAEGMTTQIKGTMVKIG